MFLMKSPPLVALQRKWEPFSPSRSCRYPICFSESEDDLARTAVSAKVQMIINNLQSEEPSLGVGDKYGCVAQATRKGAKGGDRKLRGGGRALEDHAAYGQSRCPADSDGMEVEESSEFGPLLLNSDSDDSVDRDIEEAIQEYLRNKSQLLPNSTKSLHGADGGNPPQGVACNAFPAKAEVVPQHLAPGYLGDAAVRGGPSPSSTSSDDSFEQSIRAEIEQFLNEKKQRARQTRLVGEGANAAPETLALKNQKESADGLRRSSPKRGGKALFPKRLPEPPKRSLEESADCKKASQAPSRLAAGRSCVPPQSREGPVRRQLRETRQEQSAEGSDSSSDDGIEEAIQLYQREKIKRESSAQTSCTALREVTDVATSSTVSSARSVLPGTRRKARGKRLALQATGPGGLGAACGELEKGRRGLPAANRFAGCAVAPQASCRADAAAELMCAEAILDISKTILPPPAGSGPRTLATAQSAPPSRQESDSNAVDSDDSIEQEIRAFLAVKAQAERLEATSDESRRAVQRPSSSGQPGGQSRSPKRSACGTWQRSLSRKKRLKKECQGAQQIQETPEMLSEGVRRPEDCSEPLASPRPDAADIPKAGETREVDGRQRGALTASSFVVFASPASRGRRGCSKTATCAPQKHGRDDKSSSLDSDEDLDTAIKDLLRSKRKLRKKPKDQRVPCKKKVRFGGAETLALEDKLGGSKDCKPRADPLPRSRRAKPRRDDGEEGTTSRPPAVVKRKTKSAKPVPLEGKKEGLSKSGTDTGSTAWSPRAAPSLGDDSSSVDSDDSIEQEIRKFLAEKAKDATSAGTDQTVRPPGATKPQTVPLKAKRRLWWGEDNASKKIKKMGPPTAGSRSPFGCARKAAGSSLRSGALVEDVGSQPPGVLQTSQGFVQAEGADSRVKSPAGDRQALPGGQLARRSRPLGKAGAADRKLQNYAKPLKSKNPQEFKLSSKFIAGLKSTQNKKTAVGKRQRLGGSALEREGVVSAASPLRKRRDPAPQRGVPGSGSEADLPTAERSQPCAPERLRKAQPSPLCREALSLVAGSSAGGPEPHETSPSPHLQAPDTGDFGEAKVSTETSRLEAPVEEEEGQSHRHSAGKEGCHVASSPRCLPSGALASPDRLAGSRAQEGSAEFIDDPVAEQTPCKPSSL